MDLENLNLVELNAQEIEEIDGGFLPLVLGIISIGGAFYGSGYAFGYFMNH